MSGNYATPLTNVTIESSFWNRWIDLTRTVTIPSQYRKLTETGRIGAFRLDWKPGMEKMPHVFWDSDVAKWVEAACYTIMLRPDEQISAMIDEVVALIISAQQPDGYINTHYTVVEPESRWTNLRDRHELYCAGHLMEAAVAHHEATGRTDFLQAICGYADYIDEVFGPNPGQKKGYCGHEEIELALLRLYRATGVERYLKLAEYFIEERGRKPYYFDEEAHKRGEDPADYEYAPYSFMQAGVPIREQTEMEGHAVRAMYFYSAVADLAGIREDVDLFRVLDGLWEDLTYRKTYITGGIGSATRIEGFSEPYDLPNESAYAETCAAIGSIFLNQRMLQYHPNGRYADSIETALFNGAISGMSLDGMKYFYTNPLESRGKHHRSDWHDCCCCVSNLARLIASLGRYIYLVTESEIIVSQYVGSKAEFEIGRYKGSIEQKTEYPWDGRTVIRLNLTERSAFGVKVRIPGWCEDASVTVNYAPIDLSHIEDGFIEIRRNWADGDLIVVNLPMPVRGVHANPAVKADIGEIALRRGPIVYCMEETDNPVGPFLIPSDAEFSAMFEPDLLGGVTTVTAEALAPSEAGWGKELYQDREPALVETTAQAIPYFAWDNRSPGWMRVWTTQIKRSED